MSEIWIQTDSGNNGGMFLRDAITRKKPTQPEGNRMDLFLGAFHFGNPINLAPYDRVNLLIKDSQTAANASTLVNLNVDVEDFNSSVITLSEWNARMDYHVKFEVSGAEMSYNLGDFSSREMWMVITAHNAETGVSVTLGAGALTLFQDNNTPPDGLTYMLREVYDADGDGVVDRAEVADAVDWDDVTNKPEIESLDGAVRYDEEQAIGNTEKTRARTNIGAVSAAEVATDIAAKAVRFDAAQSLSGGQTLQARNNIGAVNLSDVTTAIANRAVRFDAVQTLSAPQKAQARANLGIADSLSGAVLYNAEQELTTEEKSQARTNIGAIGSVDLTGAVLYSGSQALSPEEKERARLNIGAAVTSGEYRDEIIIHLKGVVDIEGEGLDSLEGQDPESWDVTLPTVVAIKADSTYLRFYEVVEGDGTEVADAPEVVLPVSYSYPEARRYFRLVSSEGGVHSTLIGLDEDDHPQYSLADGTRAIAGWQELNGLRLSASTVVDIEAGVIEVSRSSHRMAAETDTTDSVDTIIPVEGHGDLLLLTAASGHTITLVHNTGNIKIEGGGNLVVTSTTLVWCWFNGTYWIVCASTVGEGGGGGTTLPVADYTEPLVYNYTDPTKKVGLDARALTTGTTRSIQSPDGDSRVRDVLMFQVRGVYDGWSGGGTIEFLSLMPSGALFKVEHISVSVNSAVGIEEYPQVTLRANGSDVGTITVDQVNYPISPYAMGVRNGTDLVTTDIPDGAYLELYYDRSGAGSAGSTAYGLVMNIVGYWKLVG